jgi:hypothetical protein
MNNLYRKPSISVLVPLAKRYQRGRLKYAELTDDECQTMPKSHIAIEHTQRGYAVDKFEYKQEGLL